MARRLRIAFPSGLSYTLIANAGTFTTTGQDATFVVGSVVLATLTGSTVAAPTVGQTYTVTLSAPAAVAYTITWANASGAAVNATFSVPTSVIGVGQTTASVVVTWPTAGVGGVDFTISPAVTRAGRPIGVTVSAAGAADYAVSSSMSDVVWTHGPERSPEIGAFRVDQGDEGEGVPLRIVQRKGLTWIEQTVLGDTLAAPYTAGSPTLQISDGTYWDSPHIVFPFRVVISTAYPDTNPRKNILNVSAYNPATKTLTVSQFAYSGSGFETAAQSYPAGSYIGQDTDEWSRTLSALPAVEQGKLVNDAAAAGAVPIRSKLPSNLYSVPFDTTPYIWHYGVYAHPDVQARHANWTPYRTVSGVQQNLTTRGPVNGAAAKFSPFDGSEFWMEFTVELDSRFYLNTSLPNEDTPDDSNKWGMKWLGFDGESSVIHQVLFSHGSEDKWTLPGTNRTPFVLQTNKAGSRIGYDDYTPRTAPNDSHQLGGEWWRSPGFARLIANPNPATSGWPTPDGKLAWEIPTDTPIALAIRMRPGRARTNETQIEVRKAEFQSSSYTQQWTTVMNVSDARMNYGNSSAQIPGDSDTYPDAAITWPATTLFDVLPGFQGFRLFGYSNIRQGAFPRPMRFSFKRWLSRVTLRRSAPPPPKSEALPSYVPSPGSVAQIVQGGGVLLNNFRSTVAPYYDEVEATKAFDFSSSVINPYWGQYGAMIHYGGGHASTNYNGLHCLEFGASTINWRCLVNGSPFAGTGTDATTRWDNNRQNITMDATYKEVFVGGVQQVGRPASPHTYDARDIIGPALGGGAHGSLILIARAENSYAGANPVVAAHKVDFDTTTGATDSYVWERVANVPFVGASGEPPYSARVAPDQGRIYFEAGKASHTPIYLDLATRAYATTTGTGKTVSVGGNGVSLILVQERGLQLYLGQDGSPTNGKLQIQFRRCGANDTTVGWSTLRTLSANIPINGNPITATWCPDIQRLLVGCVHGDYDCVYEIEIPARDLDAPWQCTRRALPANAIDWSGKEAGFTGNAGWPYGGWNPKLRCWVIFRPSSSGADRVFLYRPLGT